MLVCVPSLSTLIYVCERLNPARRRRHSQVKVYVGETHNPSFAGGEPMAQLADHIAHARGPSGPNKVRATFLDFLFRFERESTSSGSRPG